MVMLLKRVLAKWKLTATNWIANEDYILKNMGWFMHNRRTQQIDKNKLNIPYFAWVVEKYDSLSIVMEIKVWLCQLMTDTQTRIFPETPMELIQFSGILRKKHIS